MTVRSDRKEAGVDIQRIADRFAPEVVAAAYREAAAALLVVERERDTLRKQRDAAMQYVAPKDREWIESLASVSPEGETPAPTAVTGTYPARGVPDEGWEHDVSPEGEA